MEICMIIIFSAYALIVVCALICVFKPSWGHNLARVSLGLALILILVHGVGYHIQEQNKRIVNHAK